MCKAKGSFTVILVKKIENILLLPFISADNWLRRTANWHIFFSNTFQAHQMNLRKYLKPFVSKYVLFANTSLHYNTGCLNKKETGTNMPVSLKLDKHLNNFGYYLFRGQLSNCTKKCRFCHVKMLRLNVKMLRLRVVHFLWYLRTFSQLVDFTGTGGPGNRWANQFPPTASYMLDTIQSQWRLSALLWATSCSVLTVQICYNKLVNIFGIWYRGKLSASC